MTTAQKERIAELRAQNYPYSFIGKALNLSPNTVKSVCRRKSFEVHGRRKTKAEKQSAVLCKNCHRLLAGKKGQLFCSESCRSDWWRRNREVTEIKP